MVKYGTTIQESISCYQGNIYRDEVIMGQPLRYLTKKQEKNDTKLCIFYISQTTFHGKKTGKSTI